MKRYDLVIVGGGTAGLVSGMVAGWAGARVALVEAERTGGDCLWTGCVPSKSLIAAADLAQRFREAPALGISGGEPAVDFGRVMAHVHASRELIEPHDSPDRLREAGVEYVEGRARYSGPGRINVEGAELRWRTSILATGSRPALPPVPGLAGCDPLTSDDIWDLTELPARLLVLGGGPVGCELGQAFSRLGSDVTIIEREDRLLPRADPEVSDLLAQSLRREGVDIWLGTRAESFLAGPGGTVSIEAVSPQGRLGLDFDRVLSATGRSPAIDDIGLEDLGVELAPGGAVLTDKRLRTTARRRVRGRRRHRGDAADPRRGVSRADRNRQCALRAAAPGRLPRRSPGDLHRSRGGGGRPLRSGSEGQVGFEGDRGAPSSTATSTGRSPRPGPPASQS